VADPFWLVCLILTATPTANNIVVLCDLAGENRRAMSAAIFYQYCFAPLLLPGVLTLFIGFICRSARSAVANHRRPPLTVLTARCVQEAGGCPARLADRPCGGALPVCVRSAARGG
jgi:hypothetical protein